MENELIKREDKIAENVAISSDGGLRILTFG
jgi:hypothetical protein